MNRICTFLVAIVFAATTYAEDAKVCWTGTWAAAAEFTGPGDMPKESLSNRSLREIVRVSIGGSQLRLQLSNEFGSSEVDINAIYIADSKDGWEIDAKTARYLTFGGKKNITIEKGQAVFSDVLKYNLKPLQRLTITINYGKRTPENATSHRGSRTTSYIIKGASKPKSSFEDSERLDHWYNIAAIDVMAPESTPSVAIIGNSITDGRGSTTNLQNRWPDFLATALGGQTAVLNLGIGGNCVLEGGLSQPALVRFDRDILGQRGVKALIIFEGVNDIGGSAGQAERKTQRLIEAYKTLIKKARDNGMKVYMGTITPFKGNGYFKPFQEAARQVVNEWIRMTDLIDGVIDFDQLARDPSDTLQLRKEYSDDWLHLSPAGYEAMGKCAAEVLSK